MEQKSNVTYRAEKTYKGSRGKFGYLIREIVSNSIHATIIRKQKGKDDNYEPKINLSIDFNDENCQIILEDNGEGFNKLNRKYFSNLDTKNSEKEHNNLHPQGQGRLAIVYFTDTANYNTAYFNENNIIENYNFKYPDLNLTKSLFDIENIDGDSTDELKIGTKLTLNISNQQTYSRAKTFFNKYDEIDKLINWFIENFFGFFNKIENLNLIIKLNGYSKELNQNFIRDNVVEIPFNVKIDGNNESFSLWLAKNENYAKSKNEIICYARHLKAEIEDKKQLIYEIDLAESYNWFLTSKYFDENVDQRGDKIEISDEVFNIIQSELNKAVEEKFAVDIITIQKENKNIIKQVKSKFPSLSTFINENKFENRNCKHTESDIIKSAIENKGNAEKSYWTNEKTNDDEDIAKLLNSSLQIYIEHRGRILDQFKVLIKKFDESGDDKRELESSIHDLLMKRGENLTKSIKINHLHNLWILDDKYAIFSDTHHGKSTRNGQCLSDIYFWIDDPDKTNELLILELKSTTSAHNAGNKYESMVAQVKRYANQFYNDPNKILNWDIDPNRILYSAIIIARKCDIIKELNSNNIGGIPNRIPFLESSYYFNEKFSKANNSSSNPSFVDIRIDMFSYEDLHSLASNRNEVFLNLLRNEFNIETEDL